MSNCAPAREIYAGLFGELGNSLSAEDWIARANISLPPNLSALKARFVTGFRTEQALQISYEPGPESFSFFTLSGGCTAEMLDQAATHCATLVTGYGCPTLTMTTNYFHRGTGSTFVANARILSKTSVSALIVAELIDQRGRRIAAASSRSSSSKRSPGTDEAGTDPDRTQLRSKRRLRFVLPSSRGKRPMWLPLAAPDELRE